LAGAGLGTATSFFTSLYEGGSTFCELFSTCAHQERAR
jgi:hypothetical protein